MLSLVAPIRFDGGETVDVEDFLDTLELSFPMLDQHVAAEKRERVRVLALQGLLDGKARKFWSSLRREKKATFQLAAAALRERFPPDREDDASEWTVKLRAWAEMGELKQGELTSKEYAEKAEGLFAALGDEHSVMLANKFLQGLRDPMLKYVMDGHLEAPFRFREVIRVFTRCTQTLRQEEAARQPKPRREEPKVENPMDLVVETMKQSQQMVGDLVKGINLLTTAGQDHMYYRPIVGTVGVERRQDQQNDRPSYQPNVDQANSLPNNRTGIRLTILRSNIRDISNLSSIINLSSSIKFIDLHSGKGIKNTRIVGSGLGMK